MKKYIVRNIIILTLLCLSLISGCRKKQNDNEDFLTSTGLDYQKAENESSIETGLNTYYYCYYDFSGGGYETNPEFKLNSISLDTEKTAIVVIDPWADMPFEELNQMIKNHVTSFITPLVKEAIQLEIPVYIFTNHPDEVMYNTKICKELQDMVDSNFASLLYYQDIAGTTSGFHKLLEEVGIENVIYTGYATQMCVLYRETGIIPMYYHDSELNYFIIPEATATVLDDENEELNQQMRNDICTMLSQQGIADIIMYEDIMGYLSSKKHGL